MPNADRLNSLLMAAALWHQRADHDASMESRAALASWLNESPENAAAYSAIDHTWTTVRGASKHPEILKLRQEAVERLRAKASVTHSPPRWAAAAIIMLCLGAALWIIAPRMDVRSLAWLKGEHLQPTVNRYATQVGERLTVALIDGSHITLNTATEIEVTLTKESRSIHLGRGEALFEVSKDKSRPFVVQTENRRLIAVGTVFDVRLDGRQVKVTMLEGTVSAEGRGKDAQTRVTVTAGQQLIANPDAETRVHRIDPEKEISWRHDQAIFDNTTLAEAVAELNRYSPIQIKIADAKLADLRLSGTFTTGQQDAFVDAITAYFPIQAATHTPGWITLKSRP